LNDVVNEKARLREKLRRQRLALDPSAASAASESIARRLEFLTARHQRVALFWPMVERREIDLRGLAGVLLDSGKQVYLPWLPEGSAGEAAVFRLLGDPEALVTHRLGFLQPAEDARIADRLDFIVAPALGATRRGERLGYGAGHYDRALASFGSAEAVAVVYDVEVLDGLPTEEHDRRVDWVVSEKRVIGPT
jgi:5-formyltetrahydrofolate cyclo-ligase